jgi:6-phosphofructokinase 1
MAATGRLTPDDARLGNRGESNSKPNGHYGPFVVLSLTVPQRTGRVVASDLEIKVLGPCRHPSPLAHRLSRAAIHYVGNADRVLLDDRVSVAMSRTGDPLRALAFELAGPRDRTYFETETLRCGIVTCGGLCPGINNVIRGLVLELTHSYGVDHVLGFRYGFRGLSRDGPEPVRLTPASVADIHHEGGTALGTSRGEQNAREMVDRLDELRIGVLFVIGGDGTLRGAIKLATEIERRGLAIAVIGIPKTIDNDIHFIDKSFGFETAYSAAVDVLRGAHAEATGAFNGVSVVKLMGRHSGFIACHAAIASTDVDVVLIPEVPIVLDGKGGLLPFLKRRLDEGRHALCIVAEGAGQELFVGAQGHDASGNARLHDIGVVLRDRIVSHFRDEGMDITVKYVDPSYHIRSVPVSPADSLYCWNMARNAVHAAMAGNTEMLVGRWHGRFVHVPMTLAARFRKQVDTSGDLWMAVVESTRQPVSWGM